MIKRISILSLVFVTGIMSLQAEVLYNRDHPLVENKADFSNLIGYEYNLWGVKAINKSGEADYEYTGRIFLDKRKDYKASYDEDEHFFFFKEKFTDGEVFKVPGAQESTQFVKKGSANEYYVALKFGAQWKHHQLRDILENVDSNTGAEVGCTTCNYQKSYYDLEKDWALTVYYEIKPIFKNSDRSVNEMAYELLQSLDQKEGFGETVALAEKPVKEETIKKVDEIVVSKSVISKPEVVTASVPLPLKESKTKLPEIVIQNEDSYHVLFRVLMNSDQTFDDLKHLGPLFKETFDSNGSTRYLIGNSNSLAEALILEQKVKEAGYNSTILASYNNGKLKRYVDTDVTNDSSSSSDFAVSNVYNNGSRGFGQPIQFTAIGKRDKTFDELSHLGEVYSEKVEGRKLYRYKLRPYSDLKTTAVIKEMKSIGFTGAFVVK